jgi:hypothetical protein
MISAQQNIECLTKLGMLKFFPVRDNVVAEIGKLLNELCHSDSEAQQLTAVVCAKHSEWPGPSKVRELYQSEIVSRRPQEALPEGCEKCDGGLRTVFTVFERKNNRRGVEKIYPETPQAARDTELELRRLHGQPTSTDDFSETVMPCSCKLGQYQRESWRKAWPQGGW